MTCSRSGRRATPTAPAGYHLSGDAVATETPSSVERRLLITAWRGGAPDPPTTHRVVRTVALVVVLSVAVLAVMAVVGRLPRPAAPWPAVGHDLQAAAVVVLLPSAVLGRRRPRVAQRASPMRYLTLRERRLLWRQMRGQAPVSPAQAPLVRFAARRLAHQRWSAGLVAGFGLLESGQALSARPGPSPVQLAVGGAAIASVPLVLWLIRQVRRLAADEPATTGSAPTPGDPGWASYLGSQALDLVGQPYADAARLATTLGAAVVQRRLEDGLPPVPVRDERRLVFYTERGVVRGFTAG